MWGTKCFEWPKLRKSTVCVCVCVRACARVRASTLQVQLSLYTYLSAEFIGTATIYSTIRRVGTVMQLLHALKFYYWVEDPSSNTRITPKGLGEHRPANFIGIKLNPSHSLQGASQSHTTQQEPLNP